MIKVILRLLLVWEKTQMVNKIQGKGKILEIWHSCKVEIWNNLKFANVYPVISKFRSGFVRWNRGKIPVTGKLRKRLCVSISGWRILNDFQASSEKWMKCHNIYQSCLSGKRVFPIDDWLAVYRICVNLCPWWHWTFV